MADWSDPLATKDYVPLRLRPVLDDHLFHVVTLSKTGLSQEIFLDYFRLKGVKQMDLNMRAGEPITLTIEMYVAGASYVDEKK